ncbi:putative membrane protein [Algoriphagus sp. 4150]|uniref:DoxX family protein n=1 Tax=Algoriphagus sp. 4150 TaxID=2817756 RepID=UPI002863DEC8|nr:DoxX family protein [Algoriphagus sp. 4150]MDR7128696.1 putative membrane protein [Algoriphagus sp. 4150]
MAIQKRPKAMNISLWAVQILLSITFIWAGFMKLFVPDDLPWLWTKENPELVWISGIVDLLAGLGLTLPTLLRIRPILTAYAAFGTIALMFSAILFHVLRGEGNQIGFNVFILISAVFIAWGRGKKDPTDLPNPPFK